MSFWEAIQRRLSPLRISDPFFGDLRYQRHACFWEGCKLFSPVNREVEFTLEADEQGPTEQQRQFFRDLESRYPELSHPVEKLLLEERTMWTQEPLTGSVWDEFVLEGFDIPKCDAPRLNWELGFQSSSSGYCYMVAMSGWEPQSVHVDT